MQKNEVGGGGGEIVVAVFSNFGAFLCAVLRLTAYSSIYGIHFFHLTDLLEESHFFGH